MTIEIRPAAVRSQISQKSNRMDIMVRSLNNSYNKVEQFCSADGSLTGAGFNAAREHMGQYRDFCLAAHECIEMTRRADQQVVGALGTFGWMSRVSEQEWLEKQRQAEQQVSSLRSQAAETERNREWFDLAAAYYARALRGLAFAWQIDADHAGRMLSKIYSYCEQTNGLYGGDLGTLTNAVNAGAQAFASCGFDAATHTWGKLDSSWKSDEVQAIIEDNLDVLLLKGYGDIDQALLIDPVASTVSNWWEDTTDAVADWWNDPDNSFARWWDDNSTTIENVGNVVFGVVGVVGGIAAIACGGGVVAAGIAGIGVLCGLADAGSGLAGLLMNDEVNWEEMLGKGVARTLGLDEETGVLVANGVSTAVALFNVKKLPANAGKLVKSFEGLSDLEKPLKKAGTLASSVGQFEKRSAVFEMAPVFDGKAAKTTEFVSDLCETADGVKNVVDLPGNAFDFVSGLGKKEGDAVNYANAASAAGGYGY